MLSYLGGQQIFIWCEQNSGKICEKYPMLCVPSPFHPFLPTQKFSALVGNFHSPKAPALQGCTGLKHI